MEQKTPARRNTTKKTWIIETLKSLGSHVSAGEVYGELRKTHPEVGRATVFRVLSDMANDGALLRIVMTGSDDKYDITAYPHNHVICRLCGRVGDVWLDGGEHIMEHVIDSCGYVLESERIEFSGICGACREKPGK